MPKEHKFVGYRKYDMTATLRDQQYTEGVDYYGGDTQVFISDPSNPNAIPIRISCLHRVSGGGIFFDMRETTCYGQLHKGWMPTLQDSDPIQLTISGLAETSVDMAMDAFDTKRVLKLMVLLPDSRFIEGLVRVEKVDFITDIDAVFGYVFSFRRVQPPIKDKGLYSIEYDLRGGKWTTPPTIRLLYRKDEEVSLQDGAASITPPTGYAFANWTAYTRGSHQTVTLDGNKIPHITDHTVIQANYKIGNAELKGTPGNPAEKNAITQEKGELPGVRGRFGALPDTSERYPIGSIITLPAKPELQINKHWRMAGWTIDGKPYEFGAQYQIMGDTVMEGRWQELAIVEFSSGTNPAGVVPEPISVDKGMNITVPALAQDPTGMFRAVTWKDAARNVVYQPEQVIKLDKDMTLTATWKPLHYAKYSVDMASVEEGTVPIDLTAYETGDHIILQELPITKEGYTFVGWERGSGDLNRYQPGEQYTVKPTDGAEIGFEAVWEPES